MVQVAFPVSSAHLLEPREIAGKHAMVGTTHAAAEADEWRTNLRGDTTFVTAPDGTRPDWYWTGRRPEAGAPGMLPDGTITALPLPRLDSCTRQAALDYFDNAWLLTEVLLSALQGEEVFYRPPAHNLRHPMIFYYAHPATLYINKLRVAGLLTDPGNAYFEHIFETGVDEMSWDDLSKNAMLWPSVREVTEYRRQVYTLVRGVIERSAAFPATPESPITWNSKVWAIFMAIEHEHIHTETSSVLIRELPLSLVSAPKQWPQLHPQLATQVAPDNPQIAVPGGNVTIGKPLDWPTYGWDNEYGSRPLHVPAFTASRCSVSNAEYLAFVCDGGYREEALWTLDGWQWRTFCNAKWPQYWVLDGPAGLHHYKLRTLFNAIDLPPSAPVIVNAHEARAFCAWRSRRDGVSGTSAYRLTTEGEWHRIRGSPTAGAGQCSRDDCAQADLVMRGTGSELRETANVALAYGGEAPVDTGAETALGFKGAHGNVWLWCEDFIAALPHSHGVHDYYDDFSSPCYDGQHSVILGGSFMSAGDVASVFARFHFRPHFHQHAGFRMVQSSAPPVLTHVDSPPPHVGQWNPSSNPQESATDPAAQLALRMLTHYSSAATASPLSGIVADSALRFPELARDAISDAADAHGVARGSLLEIGCSVGGTSFRFAERFDRVVAIDLEGQFIRAAADMQANGQVEVEFKEEGRRTARTTLARPVPSDVARRIAFRHMDPCCIAPDIGAFDVVVLNDVLQRLVSPRAPLSRMSGVKGLVTPGGLLMSVAAYDWDARVSDPKLWLGANEESGVQSHDALQALLGPEFDLVDERELQYVVREHARKFSLVLTHATIWRRRHARS